MPGLPVGVRLPLLDAEFSPGDLTELGRRAQEFGYASLWVGDHVLLPETSSSRYPHTGDGRRPFRADTPWLDPLLQLTWLAGQLPQMRFGTSVVIMTLRNPRLFAKQLATMSWLTDRPLSLGVGTGWLRDEYDAVGVPFAHRASRARQQLSEIRDLITRGAREYRVTDESGRETPKTFRMLPTAPAPVEFLWGGVSPLALRLVASSCDGWLPAKQSPDALAGQLRRLRDACDEAQRPFEELKLVVKPGPGPDPRCGRIDADSLAAYTELGFHEAILEMPYDTGGLAGAIGTLERVATRGNL